MRFLNVCFEVSNPNTNDVTHDKTDNATATKVKGTKYTFFILLVF